MVEEENEGREIRTEDDEEEVSEKTEEDWMEQFGLRHCYVKLQSFLYYWYSSLYIILVTLFFFTCIPKINSYVLL